MSIIILILVLIWGGFGYSASSSDLAAAEVATPSVIEVMAESPEYEILPAVSADVDAMVTVIKISSQSYGDVTGVAIVFESTSAADLSLVEITVSCVDAEGAELGSVRVVETDVAVGERFLEDDILIYSGGCATITAQVTVAEP